MHIVKCFYCDLLLFSAVMGFKHSVNTVNHLYRYTIYKHTFLIFSMEREHQGP